MTNTKDHQHQFALRLRSAWRHYRSFADAHTSATILLPTLLIAPVSLILGLPLSDEVYAVLFALTMAVCTAGIFFGMFLLFIMLTMIACAVCWTQDAKETPL